MAAPSFISADAILAIHELLLREHGTRPGYQSHLVESIEGYPIQKYYYADPEPTIPELAGHLGFAAAAIFHAFTDGNKRVGLMVIVTFLLQNGYDFLATNDEAEFWTRKAADHQVLEQEFVDWVVASSVKV